jgi:hypothetical protein
MTWGLQKAYSVKKVLALMAVFSMFLFNAMPFGFVQSSDLGSYATDGSGAAGFVPEGLFINELMADNQITIAGPDGTYPDWIELFNAGNEAIDLSGMYLTDNLTKPVMWRFPNNTSIASGGYLLIWADNSSDQTSLHANFALRANGEEVGLFASDGITPIDSIVFTKQAKDVSYGRFPDGSVNWSKLAPTPGFANELAEVAPVGPTNADSVPEDLFINEFMANNDVAVAGPDGIYPDWIELFNAGNETIDLSGMYLTDDLYNSDKWQFSNGSSIAAGGYLVIWADNSPLGRPLHASFGLNASGEVIALFARDGKSLIDSIVFCEQLADFSFGRFPDGSFDWSELAPTPGAPNKLVEIVIHDEPEYVNAPEGLFINELMADNQITIAGPDGTYPDWIELFYDGNETIDLGGMYLTDDLTNPTSWRFPNDTSIASGGYLLIWADNSSDQTSLHSIFRLSANGEEVGLFASDGITLIDSVVFTKQIGDVSYGRFPDGSANWTYLLKATPGWGNNKTQNNSKTSAWSILLPISIIITLSALVVVVGKIHSRRR